MHQNLLPPDAEIYQKAKLKSVTERLPLAEGILGI